MLADIYKDMNAIPNQTYYTTVLPLIVGAIPVLYVVLSILWNKKWVPRQRARQVPTPAFGNMIGRILRFSFNEDPQRLIPKAKSPFAQKFLTLKMINYLLLFATFVLLALKNENAWLPFLLLILAVWIRTAPVLNNRNQILLRMFQVASTVFRYDRGAEFNPWAYVKIKKWEDLSTPGETHVMFPAKWDASSLAARDGFERHFNGTVTDNNSWIYQWESAKGVVVCQPISHLPTRATYPGSESHEWSSIPLGLGSSGEVAVDLTQTPHMLICGSTGSGKSVLQRNLIFHCIQHNDMWRFLGVDVKRVELTPFKKYSKTILGIGANLEDGVEIVRYAKEVMETRYQEMEDKGVNHFKDLIDPVTGKPPYAIMLMIDEAFMFMSPEGSKTDEGKMRDELHGEASTILGDIARLGRASGVHLVLATQRPDATVIKGELKANLDIRIAAGRLDSTPSMMVLDSGAATMLPGEIKGRGIVRFKGEQEQFQGYFADQNWIEGWLQSHPGVEPDLYPAQSKADVEEADNAEGELEELIEEENYDFEDGEVSGEPTTPGDAAMTVSDLLKEEDPDEEQDDVSVGAPGSIVVPPANSSPINMVKEEPTETRVVPVELDLPFDDDDDDEIVVSGLSRKSTPTLPKLPSSPVLPVSPVIPESPSEAPVTSGLSVRPPVKSPALPPLPPLPKLPPLPPRQ